MHIYVTVRPASFIVDVVTECIHVKR